MRSFKILVVSVLLFCIVASVSVSVFAASDWSAELTIEQMTEVSADGTFSVRISVSDITSESGIVCAIFHVYYDTSALELVSWENGHPNGWDFSGNSSFGAEDWTSVLKDKNGNTFLMYSIMNDPLEQGVTEDDVLYCDLVFKALSDDFDSAAIRVTNISFMDRDLDDDCILPDRSLEIVLRNDESNAESSDEQSQATSSGSAESSETDESSEEGISESFGSSADTSNTSSFDAESEESEETGSAVSDVSVESDVSDETSSNRITMTVLLEDIKDEYGVSALQFKLTYKPSLLKFVSYECILPDNWDLKNEYTEDLSSVGKNGDLMFCVMNYQVGCGVKDDRVLGFRIEFEVQNVQFDPSLITMSEVMLINDNLEDVLPDDYRFVISYEDEHGALSDDPSESAQNEGMAVKILITVISCAVLLAIAVSVFVIIRKKRKA